MGGGRRRDAGRVGLRVGKGAGSDGGSSEGARGRGGEGASSPGDQRSDEETCIPVCARLMYQEAAGYAAA
jgi:hypothetical protein